MSFYKFAISPLGFDLLSVGDLEIGWALKLEPHEFASNISWQTALFNRWVKMGVFNNYTKAHVKYVFNTLCAEGVHIFNNGDHPMGWEWDYCPHPNKFCSHCSRIYIISHAEQVNQYGEINQIE